MKTIDGLTDQPVQESTIVLDDGSRVTLVLEYKPQQCGWFYSVSYPLESGETFEVKGCRLVNSPNILRQFEDLIPFGLCLISSPNLADPIGIECWVDGTAQLLLLNAEDVADIEETIFAGL